MLLDFSWGFSSWCRRTHLWPLPGGVPALGMDRCASEAEWRALARPYLVDWPTFSLHGCLTASVAQEKLGTGPSGCARLCASAVLDIRAAIASTLLHAGAMRYLLTIISTGCATMVLVLTTWDSASLQPALDRDSPDRPHPHAAAFLFVLRHWPDGHHLTNHSDDHQRCTYDGVKADFIRCRENERQGLGR